MVFVHALVVSIFMILLTRSDPDEAQEECKITDPDIYNFKVKVPENTEIPDKWFKNHPSYLNHTKITFAKFIGKEFTKFLAGVASKVPNYIEIPKVLLHPASSASTQASKGEMWMLREILAQPHNITVYSDWTGENLVVKFLLELTGLKLRYHIKSIIPKIDGPVEWMLYDGSYIIVQMRISPKGNCPIKFEENEVETVFTYTRYSVGRQEQLWHLTNLMKCYLNYIVERALYFALKHLWNVMKHTICYSVKYISENSDTSAEVF